jgi:hypothetical protein
MEYSGNGTRKSVKRTAWGVSYSVKQLLSTSPCYRTDISRTGTSQSSKIAKQEMFWKPKTKSNIRFARKCEVLHWCQDYLAADGVAELTDRENGEKNDSDSTHRLY